ncbi:MAG: glucuronate isomerase [Streptosporangiales bacterium]|nr:glucuronate isomerase [Streptosporangiales bacterium]
MELRSHPDRLLPADPRVRSVASRLHASVADLPLVSPHGHVDPAVLADDVPFADPATLLVTVDHYVTRLLHAHGVPLWRLGLRSARHDDPPPAAPREVWRTFCEHWPVFAGTPTRTWLEAELTELFGVTMRPSAQTADALFDQLCARLAEPAYRPRALYERFGLEVLATTDDPVDDLDAHRRLADDPGFRGRVVPTFRPDHYVHPDRPGWTGDLARLAEAADVDTGTLAGLVAALEVRRAYFSEHGATATDHSPPDAGSHPLTTGEAERVYAAARAGEAIDAELTALRQHLLFELARMSCDDGLVMQLHPGVLRSHHRPTLEAYGPDTGHDIPVATELTRALRPLLERFGTHPNLRLVVFTVDEDVWSRELAPLAGFYPAVYAGVPWWFLDTPDAISRFRRAVTDTTGFHKTSGFVDDTRAFCSIPARHDMARRLDCGYLAGLVAEHRLDEDEAIDLARDLAYDLPRRVFRL